MALLDQIQQRLTRLEYVQARQNRVCIVTEQGVDGRVKVQFPDEDELETDWLQVLIHRVEGSVGDFNVPALGTEGLCVFLGSGVETGFFIGGMWDSTDTTQPDALTKRRIAGDTLIIDGATLIDVGAPDVEISADNAAVVTAPVVTVDANLVQLGSPAPADHLALASKVQAMDNKIAALMASQVPISAVGPVPMASDVAGTDGTTPGGTVAVTTSWKIPVTGPIATIPSAVVEAD